MLLEGGAGRALRGKAKLLSVSFRHRQNQGPFWLQKQLDGAKGLVCWGLGRAGPAE